MREQFTKGGNGVNVLEDRRRVYQVKDASGDPVPTKEPEVVKQVMEEVKKVGATSKASFEEAMRLLTDVRKTLDDHKGKLDAMDSAKVSKQIEDIMTRQETADKEQTKRIDSLDMMIQKIAEKAPAGEVANKLMEDAIKFKMMEMVIKRKHEGVEMEVLMEEVRKAADVKEYQQFRKAFLKFLRKGDKIMSHEEQKAMSVGSDPDGGVTVTPFMSSRVVEKIWEADPYRQLCNIETISTDTFELLQDLDEASDGFEGETETSDETTTPQLKKKQIKVHTQYSKPRTTQQLLEDSSINIEQYLANKVGQRMARTEGDRIVNGQGVNCARGFLTYDNGTGYGNVEQTNMGAAATITTDGLIDVQFSLMEEFLTRAVWVMNRLTLRDIMKLKDGDGQYIWRPGILQGQPSVLLGNPTRMSTSMPTVAADALAVAIADWNEFYTIVDRLGLTVQRDPYTVKPFIEFYFRRRWGGDVVNFQAGKIGKVAV